jgi:hypothetical protein
MQLNKQICALCKNERERWLNEKCKEIENDKLVCSKSTHLKINEITGRKAKSDSAGIKSKNGTLLLENDKILT